MTVIDSPPAGVRLGAGHPTTRSPVPARFWIWFTDRTWPTFVVFFVVALVATLTSTPGAYIGDSRYEIYANPVRRLAKGFELWDPSRGLGRVREDLWVGINAPLALLRAVGLDPAATERVWHALLLALVGTGVVAVLTLFRSRIGPEHLIAGFCAAFGTYSLSFLTPFSDIYLQFALAPWLVVVFARGVVSHRPWRWAAGFALLVAIPGNVDIPGLILAASPLAALALYLVFVSRQVRLGHLVAWVARAGGLTALVSAAVLTKLYLASAVFGQRLNDTEAADISFRASSWTESWRGLGNWLSYFRTGSGLLKPQSAVYFSTVVVVGATLVPAVVAVAYFALSRWRPRILFALMMLSSLIVMVGAYPLYRPSPAGGRLLDGLQNVAVLGAFRNTYKAGSGLVIGVSILFGCAVVAVVRHGRDRVPGVAALAGVAAVGVLVVNATPFWTGGIYNAGQSFGAVPAYWTEATSWLDRQPGPDRVLIAPMSSRAQYRWGWIGDDILDSMLTRPHSVATGVALSAPQAANLLEQVSMGLSDPAYRPGSLAPVLRRLGFRYVLLRNDLDWRALGRPRPDAFNGLRHDPDFVVAATFGDPGTNTTAPDDASAPTVRERELAPIEVLELRDPGPTGGVQAVSTPSPLVMSGDGAAWLGLARIGALDGDRPVLASGGLDPEALTELVQRGAPLYITDTNRRRLRVLLGYEPDYSQTLAAGQDLDRLTPSLFKRAGTQSVAWYRDATVIYEMGRPVRTASGSTPWNRAANAFDANPATSWTVTRNEIEAANPTLHVDLRPRTDATGRTVFPQITNVGVDVRNLSRLQLRFSNGKTVDLSTEEHGVGRPGEPGVQRMFDQVDSGPVSWVEVVVPHQAPSDRGGGEPTLVPGAATGSVVDVAFDGLDLAEYVQTPEDVLAAATGSERAAVFGSAPTTYVFSRSIGEGPVAEEVALRRRFPVLADRAFTVSGELRLKPDNGDATVARLLNRPIVAAGARANETEPGTWAQAAVDGDPATSWVAPPGADQPLTLTLRNRGSVSRVGVMTSAPEGSARVESVSVEISPGATRTSTTAAACPGRPDPTCRLFVIDLGEPVSTSVVTVRAQPAAANRLLPTRIDEVALNDQRVTTAGSPSDRLGCVPIGNLRSGTGSNEALLARPDGTVGDLLAGRPLRFTGCADLDLGRGWQQFDSGIDTGIEHLTLASARAAGDDGGGGGGGGGESLPPPALAITERTPTDLTVSYDTDHPTTLINQQSWAPGWEATVDGRSLGPPVALNTFAGWEVPDTGRVEVHIRYRGDRIFQAGVALSMVGVVLCGWLIIRRPRTGRRQP